MKIAVIGGGPSAFGALARLVALKQAGHELKVDVFTTGHPDQERRIEAAYQPAYTDKSINAMLKEGKRQGARGVLPVRSFNGQALCDHIGQNIKTNIKISETFGGIGNYWSSSVFPVHSFTDPLSDILGDLTQEYRFIAAQIPISGAEQDSLGHFFDETSINHPPIDLAEDLMRLRYRSDGFAGNDLELAIGTNRFALNTNADQPNGCIQCGGCVYGCPRDAMFRAARAIAAFARDEHCQIKFKRVSNLRSVNGKIHLQADGHVFEYDRAYICCGALGSVELLGKSYGRPNKPIYLYDNLLWYFPAFSARPRKTRLKDKNIAFAELAGGLFDHTDQSYNHLLISAFPDAVMENRFSRNALTKALTQFLSRHFIVCAMYGSHEEYIRYRIEQAGDTWRAVSMDSSALAIDSRKFHVFKEHLARNGWRASAKLMMDNGTSGHYTANLGEAYGIEKLVKTGAFDYNMFVCDSSSWNVASMSQQHTFTIMANASRIVQSSFM